jgi:hypothetical protein
VSNNVFFELGYVLARYGTRKIHCVKKREEKIVLPSDFDSSFVEPIASGDDEAFARGIVDYFLKRQKMSIPEEKMTLIDNRYQIKEKIASHYSSAGSKCSDYELAQYIIFYMQAAHMFEDEKKVQKEIEKFHREHNTEFSLELRCAVKMCLSFFKLTSEIKSYPETSNVYIDEDISAWKAYEPVYPRTWVTGYEFAGIIREEQIYDVRAIPSLYLLDREYRIVMKDAPTERVLAFLDRIAQEQN